MTTYEVDSRESRHGLVASWPDLPERASQLVATFEELKLAAVAKSVLGAASRYRWRRRLQQLDEGVFTDQSRSPEVAELPALPTEVVLGEAAMPEYLERRIEALLPAPGHEPEELGGGTGEFSERVQLGNLRPLLWKDWCSHLQPDEHVALRAELEADLEATTGAHTGRARQAAWYLSAELLIDEDHSRLARNGKGTRNEEAAKAFQASLVRLLGDLTGLRVESTAIDWDPDNEELLRVYSPVTAVGFWLDEDCWYYGWPDADSPEGQATLWEHAGTLPTDTSIGDMAGFIAEQTAGNIWPFGGAAPSARRGRFGGRR